MSDVRELSVLDRTGSVSLVSLVSTRRLTVTVLHKAA